jgi:hypothetical protein
VKQPCGGAQTAPVNPVSREYQFHELTGGCDWLTAKDAAHVSRDAGTMVMCRARSRSMEAPELNAMMFHRQSWDPKRHRVVEAHA